MQVISGIEAAVKSMKLGGVRRVIIPPSQGYQSTSQEPIPPDVTYPVSLLKFYLKLLFTSGKFVCFSFLTGRDYLQPFLIQLVLPMEKALL